MAPELTAEEIERMRQLVAAHDGQHKPVTTVDLNNPPRVPYRFQKFPMIVYDLENSYAAHDVPVTDRLGNPTGATQHVTARIVSRVVNSEHELHAALEDGWSENAPEFREVPEEVLSSKYLGEAERVQAQIDEAKRRRGGRPRKDAA